MTTEILPCPFCGNKAEAGENGDNSPNWFIACSRWDCCMLDGFRTEEAAIAAWNKRAPLPDDVFDAIGGLIGFACNPRHMDDESLAMAYTVAKWLQRQRQEAQ